jgi:hypothetical protein
MRIPFSRRSSKPGGARVDDSLTTRLAAAARAQTANPGGHVSDPRQPWRDRAPDVWAVSVEGHDRTALAAFRVTGERASVPAGPAQGQRRTSAAAAAGINRAAAAERRGQVICADGWIREACPKLAIAIA